eukprot:6380962-Pyramimonas_sp.AAC.1
MGVRDACGPTYSDLRRSSLWGHEACKDAPEWMCGTHAGTPTRTFGGAPHGATKRVRSVPKCACGTHANAAAGAF